MGSVPPVACEEAMAQQLSSFPAGLKVLVVDDDPLCLKVIDQMLRRCNYAVTTSPSSLDALRILRSQRENHFDLVLSDVYMPDMDGFKLLEVIGLEMGLPVIMMSSNGDTGVVFRGVTHGAVDFLIKPVRIEELRNLWQHVVRKKSLQQHSDKQHSEEEGEESKHRVDRKRKESRSSGGKDAEEGSHSKKPRVVWSVEMHQQFVNAVNQLGIDKAVPKRILDLMNVDGLTRENVASHLQKYRLYLKRVAGISTGSRGAYKGGPGDSRCMSDASGSMGGMPGGPLPMGMMPPHLAAGMMMAPGPDGQPRPFPIMPGMIPGIPGGIPMMQLPPGMPPPPGMMLAPMSMMASLGMQQGQPPGGAAAGAALRSDMRSDSLASDNGPMAGGQSSGFAAILGSTPMDQQPFPSQQQAFGPATGSTAQQHQQQQHAQAACSAFAIGGASGSNGSLQQQQSDLEQLCGVLGVPDGLPTGTASMPDAAGNGIGGVEPKTEPDDFFNFLLKDSSLMD